MFAQLPGERHGHFPVYPAQFGDFVLYVLQGVGFGLRRGPGVARGQAARVHNCAVQGPHRRPPSQTPRPRTREAHKRNQNLRAAPNVPTGMKSEKLLVRIVEPGENSCLKSGLPEFLLKF